MILKNGLNSYFNNIEAGHQFLACFLNDRPEMTIIQFPKKDNSCKCGCESPQTILTLPVAPRPFSRIRFDQIDSPVKAVPPAGALQWLEENLQQGAKVKAVNIDGPGDPLCEIDSTLETLHLIRQKYPDIKLSVTTLGLHAEKYAKSLMKAGVKSVILLVDAVEQRVADRLYAWIRPGRKTIPLAKATEMLIKEQLLAVKAFTKLGCKVIVRTTVYPGFNDEYIEEISRKMGEAGAEKMLLVPCCKTSGEQEEPFLRSPDSETMQNLQKRASKHLATLLSPEKENCIGADCPSLHGACKNILTLQPKPTKAKPNVAVVSSNGMEVDIHLGQAYQVLIYGPREDGLPCLLGTRSLPEPGSGSSRWEELAESLDDCFAILTASAGETPRRILGNHGIAVLITENEIEGTVDVLFGGGKKGKKCGR